MQAPAEHDDVQREVDADDRHRQPDRFAEALEEDRAERQRAARSVTSTG